jgi:hypothetical protein
MTSLSKGFAYMFNTVQEDRAVARVLSGWAARSKTALLDLSSFDAVSQDELRALRNQLFSSCIGFNDDRFNVAPVMLDHLTAYLIRGYPELKAMSPTGASIVRRIEGALAYLDIGLERMLAWSVHLQAQPMNVAEEAVATSEQSSQSSAALKALADSQQLLVDRIRWLEEQLEARDGRQSTAKRSASAAGLEEAPTKPAKQRRKAGLADHWYQWYASVPPMWTCSASDRRSKSTTKHIVSFMRLLATDGYTLDPKSETYRSTVMSLGQQLEARTLEFLKDQGQTATSGGTVLKAMRLLQTTGALDSLIDHHVALVATGRLVDPMPRRMLEFAPGK